MTIDTTTANLPNFYHIFGIPVVWVIVRISKDCPDKKINESDLVFLPSNLNTTYFF